MSSSNYRLQPRSRGGTRRAAGALILGALLAFQGCGDVALRVSGAGLTTDGFGTIGQSPVGRWSRVDPAGGFGVPGSGYVYQIVWHFAGDGSAVRTTRTLTPAGAPLESLSETARWSADGRTLCLAFDAPSFVTRCVPYRVEVGAARTTLFLDEVAFVRAGQ